MPRNLEEMESFGRRRRVAFGVACLLLGCANGTDDSLTGAPAVNEAGGAGGMAAGAGSGGVGGVVGGSSAGGNAGSAGVGGSGDGGGGGSTNAGTGGVAQGGEAGAGGSGGSGGSAMGGGAAGASTGGSGGMGLLPTLDGFGPQGMEKVTVEPGNLIDDAEAGTGAILQLGGRQGDWFAYNDGSGVQNPAEGASFNPTAGGISGSSLAIMTFGSGFSDWGAGIGFDLNSFGGARETYDVSAFTGIAFWAKGTTNLRVAVVDAATIPIADGGTCAANCSDTHGRSIALTQSWEQYTVSFAEVTQSGWGTQVTFDETNVLGLQLDIEPGVDFEIWIDQIGFYVE